MPHVGDNGYLDKEIENVRRYNGKTRLATALGSWRLPLAPLDRTRRSDRPCLAAKEQSLVRVYLIDEHDLPSLRELRSPAIDILADDPPKLHKRRLSQGRCLAGFNARQARLVWGKAESLNHHLQWIIFY